MIDKSMKTFKVKNYKGNLVESLKRFSDSHKGMKIVEACEDEDGLKIKAEESEKIEEAVGKKVYIVKSNDKHSSQSNGIFAIATTKEIANKLEAEYHDGFDPDEDDGWDGEPTKIVEVPCDVLLDRLPLPHNAKSMDLNLVLNK